MNSNQLAANPSSLHPELALNSLQTQPEFFPVMHLMVPPLNSLSPSLCNSPCKQKPLHFPASLMKLLAELFLKIKSLFWRQRECEKEWEARYLFLLTGETGHCGISNLVKMVSNLPHVKKMFPKFTKFFCRTIKWNIYLTFLQNYQLSMLSRSIHSSVCNTDVHFHTIWIFCVLPRYSVPSLWRKENLIYDFVSMCITLMLLIQVCWQANPHTFNNFPLKTRICSIPWWCTLQYFHNLCPPALTLECQV